MLNCNRSRGVTLIELAIGIALLALLLAAAGPSVALWMRNNEVRNTASSILAGLTKARNEAVRRNQPMRFSLVSLSDSAVMDDSCALSAAGASWVVSVLDPAGKCSAIPKDKRGAGDDAADPLIAEKAAGGIGGAGVAVSAMQSDGTAADTVTFNAFGRVVGAAPIDRIAVSNDSRTLRITIQAGGAIRMCDEGITTATDPRKC
jgi:type IV fimbrial biogenesis protein FimT